MTPSSHPPPGYINILAPPTAPTTWPHPISPLSISPLSLNFASRLSIASGKKLRVPQCTFSWGQVSAFSHPHLPAQRRRVYRECPPLLPNSKIPRQTHSLSAAHFLPNLRKLGPTGMNLPEVPSLPLISLFTIFSFPPASGGTSALYNKANAHRGSVSSYLCQIHES